MKIHILYNFEKGPWGGGNQFLKALKKELKNQGLYEEEPEKAEVILFNSHHRLGEALKIKLKQPQKVLIHRLGPVFNYYRGKRWKKYDRTIVSLTNQMSDGAVFQSLWSKKQASKMGFSENTPCQVIYNAADSVIFNQNNKKPFQPQEKIKLVSLSWSANPKKGFDTYQYLDKNLDFSKYEMTFVGNSSIQFENIKMLKPVPSEKVAEVLKQNDIFIFAAKHEACSNALIEALSCGLPVVAVNSASNAEILKRAGELFAQKEEIIEKIEQVVQNYQDYKSYLPEFSIKKSARQYYMFSQKVYNDIKQGSVVSKKVGFTAQFYLRLLKLFQKLCF